MRHNLITTFHCADCGNKLEVAYKASDLVKVDKSREEGDPTGADVCYNQIIVRPCKVCIDKHTGPAKMLARALSEMLADIRERTQE